MQTDEINQDMLSESDQASLATNETPGELLKAERLRRGFDEKYISEKLHITMHYVRSIEANRFDKLPGAVFAKGYIKSYALLLELDVDALTDLFDAIHTEQQGMKEEASRRQIARRRSDRNKPWVYASAATVLIGGVALWAINHDSAPDNAPVRTNAASMAEASAVNASQPDAQISAAAPTSITLSAAPAPDLPEVSPPLPTSPAPANTAADSGALKPDLLAALAALSQQPVVAPGTIAESAPTGATDSTSMTAGRVIAIAGDGEDVLRISFSGESWIEVNDSEAHQIYRDIREAGDVLEITGHAPFNILVGDAPYTKMTLNGAEIDVSDNIRIDNSARLTVGL
jgi:cytoskeleton protein RodZ